MHVVILYKQIHIKTIEWLWFCFNYDEEKGWLMACLSPGNQQFVPQRGQSWLEAVVVWLASDL